MADKYLLKFSSIYDKSSIPDESEREKRFKYFINLFKENLYYIDKQLKKQQTIDAQNLIICFHRMIFEYQSIGKVMEFLNDKTDITEDQYKDFFKKNIIPFLQKKYNTKIQGIMKNRVINVFIIYFDYINLNLIELKNLLINFLNLTYPEIGKIETSFDEFLNKFYEKFNNNLSENKKKIYNHLIYDDDYDINYDSSYSPVGETERLLSFKIRNHRKEKNIILIEQFMFFLQIKIFFEIFYNNFFINGYKKKSKIISTKFNSDIQEKIFENIIEPKDLGYLEYLNTRLITKKVSGGINKKRLLKQY